MVRDPDPEWYVKFLNITFAHCDSLGLREVYRARFAAIKPSDVWIKGTPAWFRDGCLPIWEVANELVVAAYIARVLGWRFCKHEPAGRGLRKGDWEFAVPDDKRVFVEVKTLEEPPVRPSNSFGARPSRAPRLQNVLARAYKQLLQDERATLVVVVGHDFIRAPFGIVHSDLFAALFGQFIVKFPVMSEKREISYAGPSWREMLVGHTKRRSLGVAAGLVVRGAFSPNPHFYAIHNPFATESARLTPDVFGTQHQFRWEDSAGAEVGTLDTDDAWARLSHGLESA